MDIACNKIYFKFFVRHLQFLFSFAALTFFALPVPEELRQFRFRIGHQKRKGHRS